MNKRLGSVFAAALLAVTAIGCNASSEGDQGNVNFTPDNCGRTFCDFDDSIAVGGYVLMNIMGNEGISTAGATIVSDDPTVLEIVPVADVGGQPTWELTGINPGVARLEVYDATEALLDTLEVPVQDVGSLGLINGLGDAVGPEADPQYDEVWTVNADQAVSLRVTPFVGNRSPLMGVFSYVATIDQVMSDGLIDTDLSGGRLYFSVPAGDYVVSWIDDQNRTLDVLIRAVAAPMP